MKWSLQTFQRCLVQPGFIWRSFAQKRHAEPVPRANGGAFPLAVVCPNFGFIRIKLGFLVFSTPWLTLDVRRIKLLWLAQLPGFAQMRSDVVPFRPVLRPSVVRASIFPLNAPDIK